MHSTYAQTQKTAQKKEASTAAAVLDASSQSEGLQRKADMMNNAAQRAEAPRPNNTGMPDNLKSGIESLSGFSMDDVRVHYNSSKPATVQALAYTQGTDIHVAPGQEKHLPHEAWHVAQQMAGRVSPTTNINGMAVNDNAGLEHEADVMGEKAVQCKEIETNGKNASCLLNHIVQCQNILQRKGEKYLWTRRSNQAPIVDYGRMIKPNDFIEAQKRKTMPTAIFYALTIENSSLYLSEDRAKQAASIKITQNQGNPNSRLVLPPGLPVAGVNAVPLDTESVVLGKRGESRIYKGLIGGNFHFFVVKHVGDPNAKIDKYTWDGKSKNYRIDQMACVTHFHPAFVFGNQDWLTPEYNLIQGIDYHYFVV